MARGVGALNVSVNANTSQAVQQLKIFREEAKQTAAVARQAAMEFRGNKIADYEQRFGQQSELKQSAAAAAEFAHSMVDLREQTNRYSKIGKENTGIVKEAKAALATVAMVSKHVAAALAVLKISFEFTQGIKRHAEYVHSAADAWREFKAAIGLGKGGLELEMEHLDQMQRKAAANIARQEKTLADHAAKQKRNAEIAVERRRALQAADRERRIVEQGKETVEWEENRDRFGIVTATRIAEIRDRMKTAAEQQEKARQAAEQQKEAAMRRELEHQNKLKQDRETLKDLDHRIADFWKTDFAKQRDEILRGITNAKEKSAAVDQFRVLEQLERRKEARDQRQTDRDILASRRSGQGDRFLDARSAEGWAALRNSARSTEDKTADRANDLLFEILSAIKDKPREEIIRL